MAEESLTQRFAIDNNGHIVSIQEVSRGSDCGCVCPACRDPVIAKQGDIRIWHFAHRSGVDCGSGVETAIHLAAKEVIAKHKGLTLPGATARRSVTLPDGRKGVGEASIEEVWCDFRSVTMEPWLGGLRPDVLGECDGPPILIEIAVSHFVEQAKHQQLVERSWPALEIDLSWVDYSAWDWEMLETIVVNAADSKRWLFCPWAAEMESAALEAATRDAKSKPTPLNESDHGRPVRTRLWIEGRMVDVIDLGFGTAVWSPYDAVITERIKRIVKPLGARWKHAYKNWLMPPHVRPALMRALEEAGAKSSLEESLNQPTDAPEPGR